MRKWNVGIFFAKIEKFLVQVACFGLIQGAPYNIITGTVPPKGRIIPKLILSRIISHFWGFWLTNSEISFDVSHSKYSHLENHFWKISFNEINLEDDCALNIIFMCVSKVETVDDNSCSYVIFS